MQFADKVLALPIVIKLKKFFPAVAFLVGFGWDSWTLGHKVYGTDLLILLAYYIAAFVFVVLLSARLRHSNDLTQECNSIVSIAPKEKNGPSSVAKGHHFLDREWSDTWKNRFSWMVQFCFGSLFSALVVCYFKSSGSLASFVLVLLLACLLVGNEFFQKKYESFGFTLAFFSLLGTMFMNFAIPHLVHRMGFIWFFISTLLSFGICTIILVVSHRSWKLLIVPGFLSILLILAYVLNWVPPVPLVLKQQMACQNFDKASYSCDVDVPSIIQKVGLKASSVHRIKGKDVYVVSSVYAPAELKAGLEYRWYYQDPKTGNYNLTDVISSGRMTIRGGRDNGFRSFSKKSRVPAGKYRVETTYKGGAVIGAITFDVFDEEQDASAYVRDTLK